MAHPTPDAVPSPAPESTSDIVHATNLSTCVLVVLVLTWCLGGHHFASRSRYLTEGSAACALGLATGLILLVVHHYLSWDWVTQLLEFNAAGFFTYLLPPVIFYCGLSVEHERFFYALPSILMYGVFGTLASFAIISIFMYGALGFALFKMEDCLAMGAIFAATDSVATLQVLDRTAMPGLFSLVFGEGVVNDAVSVVLLGAVANTAKAREAAKAGHVGGNSSFVFNFVYLLITSLLLGAAAGLGIAMALKKLTLQDAHQEMAVIALLSYFSYLLADVCGLSGILSLFVCGVVVSHYALHNVSEEGNRATMTGFRTASYLAEGIIFIYVGMDALDPLKWKAANGAEALWLVVVLTVLLAAARAAFVVPFSLLHNCWSSDKLSSRDIVVVWWAGLMRGAVSVALVYYYFDDNPRQMLDRGRATLIVSTLMVVMLSILGFGALTKPLLAAMLGGDGSLRDQLRSVPLISTFTRVNSSAGLLLEHLDNSFGRSRSLPGAGTAGGRQPGRPGATSSNSSGGSVEGSNEGDAQNSVQLSSGDHCSASVQQSSSGSVKQWGVHDGSRGGGMWGYGGSGMMGGSKGGGSEGNGSSSQPSRGAPHLNLGGISSGSVGQEHTAAAAGSAVAAAAGPRFAGLNLDELEEPAGLSTASASPWISLDDDIVLAVPADSGHVPGSGLSFSRLLGQQQQQQRVESPAGVEMQSGLWPSSRSPDSTTTSGGTVMVAMRQMGQAWGVFDREVMQPMFGGPASGTAPRPPAGDSLL